MSNKPLSPNDDTVTTRDLKRQRRQRHYDLSATRWAIIVGISQYKYEAWNLNYAHRDAEELYRLIQKPTGGGFDEENIKLLTDDKATTGEITRALRSFLKRPAKGDLVLLYFACHGTPDPDRPGNIYLLSHDTDPNDIAGTALPMREINLALKETLHAERVVILADTCHSAAIGGRMGRDVSDRAQEVNRYLEALSQSRSGVAMITSAEANEKSREDVKWGDGHGVFTHFLLEGMRGKADYRPKNGTVTIGELFDYVREEVQNATNGQQHPTIGTTPFDRDMPMAIIGRLAADEHFQLGCDLYQLAWKLDDKYTFETAANQLKEAINLSRLMKEDFPQAYHQLGLTLLALGRRAEACEAFEAAIAQTKEGELAASYFYLGLAYTKLKDEENAQRVLATFIEDFPDDDRISWVRELLQELRGTTIQKKALLIGISDYQEKSLRLRGPANDVLLMQEILTDNYDFISENIQLLTDAEVTREGMLAALSELVESSNEKDLITIYFSGHAHRGEREIDEYLAPYDVQPVSNDPNVQGRFITAQEFQDQLNKIAAKEVLVILDTHVTSTFLQLARSSGKYTLLLATTPKKQAYEHITVGGKPIGLFTYTLANSLRNAPKTTPLAAIMDQVKRDVMLINKNQEPMFVGDPEIQILVDPERQIERIDDVLRESYDSYTREDIRRIYQKIKNSSLPLLHYHVSRSLLEKGDYVLAEIALNEAIRRSAQTAPNAYLRLAIAQLRLQRYEAAEEAIEQYVQLMSKSRNLLEEPLYSIRHLQQESKYALLVGIDEYEHPAIPNQRGAVNDARAVEQVLINRCSFQPEDIVVITNQQATRQNILKEFGGLVQRAHEAPSLFFFAGCGSKTLENQPTIVPANGRMAEVFDIELYELAKNVGQAPTNLVTIFDTGWIAGTKLPWGNTAGARYVGPDDRRQPMLRDFIPPVPDWEPSIEKAWTGDAGWYQKRRELEAKLATFQIGRLSLFHSSIQTLFDGAKELEGASFVESELLLADEPAQTVHGALTHTLVSILNEANLNTLTVNQLQEKLAKKLKWLQPFMVSSNGELTLLGNPLRENQIEGLLTHQVFNEPLRRIVSLTQRLVERRGDEQVELYVCLGVAQAALGVYDKAVDALMQALKEPGEFASVHYHLGRVLLESGHDLPTAVSELRKATELDAGHTLAYYYLGKAIQQREREALLEADNSWRKYLERGAPMGRREEVQSFLQSRIGRPDGNFWSDDSEDWGGSDWPD